MTEAMSGSFCTQQASLAAWSTPQKIDAEMIHTTPETVVARMNRNPNMSTQIQGIAIQSQLTNWQTPTAADAQSRDRHNQRDGTVILSMLGEARLTDSGETPNGSTAATGNTGQLNPALPCWLQGLPTEWESCADMVIRLLRRSRKPSSKHS
jgi:hypothetical protein